MEDKKRIKKRIKVSLVYFSLILVLGAVIYFIVSPNPSCQDGVQNQNEQGVDCGGPCFPCISEKTPEDLDILSAEVVHDVDNKYDVAIDVKNLNEIFGASNVSFRIVLEDSSGAEIVNREVKNYFILPKEEKYFIVQGLLADLSPSLVKIDIEDVTWEKFSQYEEPRLTILNTSYTENPNEGGFSKITGTLVNKSGIDFETVKVNAVLLNENGKLLATNYQILNTIRADEQRDFVMFFPHEFPGSVADVKIEPETNVFDSENYLKSYGTPEEWRLEEK